MVPARQLRLVGETLLSGLFGHMAHDATQDLNERHQASGDGVPPLSYAQNMEDYHLSLAFAGKPRGAYIDIGGGHPIAGCVSFWFYERGWSGVVAEPQKALAALHRQLRPRDRLVPFVIGRQSSEVDFFLVDRLRAVD